MGLTDTISFKGLSRHMPELPDVEATRLILSKELRGKTLTNIEFYEMAPKCLRSFPEDIQQAIGSILIGVKRRGKLLLLDFELLTLVFEAKLGGKIRKFKKPSRWTCLNLVFNDIEIEFSDNRGMAKIYVLDTKTESELEKLGPEADSDFPCEYIRETLRKHRGEVKSYLVNQKILAGIGNAYSDEILFAAGIYPFAKSKNLLDEESTRLCKSISSVLRESLTIIKEKTTIENLGKKFRDHLKIHYKTGEECPKCGNPISEITARNKLTNFCRKCQKNKLEMFR